MRAILLLLVLLLRGSSVFAQAPPRPTPTDTVALAAPDTAAAIHRLFTTKRRTFRYVALGTILVAGTAMIVVAAGPNTESKSGNNGFGIGLIGSSDDRGLAAFGIGVSSVPVLLVETLFCVGWSRKKERRALEAWQRHKLPALYQRKLKPKYFQPRQPPG